MTGCSSNNNKFENCADSMFVLTNTLMQKRMPTEAKSSDEIAQFNANSYEDKKKSWLFLCQVCLTKVKKEFSDDYQYGGTKKL